MNGIYRYRLSYYYLNAFLRYFYVVCLMFFPERRTLKPLSNVKSINIIFRGRIKEFYLEGVQKIMTVCSCTSRARSPKSLTAGVQGPLTSPRSSVFFHAL